MSVYETNKRRCAFSIFVFLQTLVFIVASIVTRGTLQVVFVFVSVLFCIFFCVSVLSVPVFDQLLVTNVDHERGQLIPIVR